MADGELLHGQLLYGQLQIPVPYTQQEVDKVEADALCVGSAGTEVKPTNRGQSQVNIYGTNGVVDLSAYFVQLPTVKRKLDLPNVLSSLTIVYQKGGNSAFFTETGSGSGAGTAFGLGLSVSGTAQAAASCIPSAEPVMAIPSEFTVATIDYIFFSPTITDAAILSILTAKIGTAVNAWPVFKPKPIFLTLYGARSTASIRGDYQATASVSLSGGSTTNTSGIGEQYGVDQTIQEQQFPPTLHGSLSLTPTDSASEVATVAVTVGGSQIGGSASGAATASAGGAVSPSSIAATSPTDIPKTGMYLYKIAADDAKVYGNYLLRATVVDMSQYA